MLLSHFKQFKNKFNGRGIVLTIGNQHSDYAVSLIHLLRALDNKLPIQIVYYDDVNEESKRKIVTAAQEDFRSLPHSFEKLPIYLVISISIPKVKDCNHKKFGL